MAYDPFLTKQSLTGVVERVSNTPPPITLTWKRTVAPTTSNFGEGTLTFSSGEDYSNFITYMTPEVNGTSHPTKGEVVAGRKIPIRITQSLYPLFDTSYDYVAEIVSLGRYRAILEITHVPPAAPPVFNRYTINNINLTSVPALSSAYYMNVILPKTSSLQIN